MNPMLRRWHRWFGLALGGLMLIWFLSGGVMMYAHLPGKYKTSSGQLQKNSPLTASQLKVGFAEAWRLAGKPKHLSQAFLENLNGRPVYRFLSRPGGYRLVWADNGQLQNGIGPDLARDSARSLLGLAGPLFYEGMVDYDQWTVGGGSRAWLRPFHKFSLNDCDGTQVYVSGRTGGVCQVTTTWSRFWSWTGAIPHWLYFTVLRQHLELWRWTIIILAALGCVLCLSGLWLGVIFFRFSGWGRGRRRRLSAFVGLRKRHHYLGLAFGLPALAWVFSGMMSLHPFDWCTPASPNEHMKAVWTGGPLKPQACILPPNMAVAALTPGYKVKMLRLISFQGKPYYLIFNEKGASRLAPAWMGQAAIMGALPVSELTAVAKDMLPGYRIEKTAWLPKGGLYLPRWKAPILRVIYNDPAETWLYLDPKRAVIVRRLDNSSRLNRWLYRFLHCLDLPWLLERPSIREPLLLILLAGGSLLCFTGPYSWLKRRRRKRLTENNLNQPPGDQPPTRLPIP